jgi:V/A-type H+/Na+-transporting ATPase subunit I
MQKVAVVAHRSEKENLIDLLHKEGVMEISDLGEAANADHPEVPYRAAELDHVIAKLTEHAPKETIAAISQPSDEKQIVESALKKDIRAIIDAVHALEEQHGTLTRDLQELGKGRLPDATLDVNAAEEGTYFTSSKVKGDLSHFGGVGVGQSAAAMEEQVKIARAETEKKLQDNDRGLRELSLELPHLVRARQYVSWLDQKHAARKVMKETRSTVTLFGWIAKHLFQPLEDKLHHLSPATALLPVEPGPDEQAPVILKNPFWLKPFESVTTLYGLPQPSEIDPTPLLAPFFIVFFGLCLTDAGYGFVLALIMGLYLWKKKLSIHDAPLWWLLFIGGIVTFFVSIPFGGWFGLDPQVLGETQSWAKPFLKIIGTQPDGDPVYWFKGQVWHLGTTQGIAFLQYLSLALGILHLSFGIFMSGVMKWRAGDKIAAFMNDWTALIVFVTSGAAVYASMTNAPWAQSALYALYASLALLLIGKGWGSTWFLVPVFGLLGILNLAMGMLSNTLSYLRLLALGLVTGALALAVNLVAEQFGALLPFFLGVPVSIIIYLVGHTLNLALNVLGAFIHSGRLQFVEFFGNFFEGGGRPYTPFKR